MSSEYESPECQEEGLCGSHWGERARATNNDPPSEDDGALRRFDGALRRLGAEMDFRELPAAGGPPGPGVRGSGDVEWIQTRTPDGGSLAADSHCFC